MLRGGCVPEISSYHTWTWANVKIRGGNNTDTNVLFSVYHNAYHDSGLWLEASDDVAGAAQSVAD